MIQILREKHDTPESVNERLRLAGGLNKFGLPNYRAVWGWNRLEWDGQPKYPQVNRWHIERWMPPETYGSPEAWYAQTEERENGKKSHVLGPYPVHGEYEHAQVVEGPGGEFVQLTSTVAERIARLIEASRNADRGRSREALYKREEKADKEYENWAYDAMTA